MTKSKYITGYKNRYKIVIKTKDINTIKSLKRYEKKPSFIGFRSGIESIPDRGKKVNRRC